MNDIYILDKRSDTVNGLSLKILDCENPYYLQGRDLKYSKKEKICIFVSLDVSNEQTRKLLI